MGKERPPKVFYEEKTNKYYVKVGNRKIYLNVGKMTKEQILQKILSTFKVRQKNKKKKGLKGKKEGKKGIPVENPVMNAMKNEFARLISDANNGQVINLRQQNEDMKRRMAQLEKEYKELDFSMINKKVINEELKKKDHARDKRGLLENKKDANYKGVAAKPVDVDAMVRDNYDTVPIGDINVYTRPGEAHKLRGLMNNKTDEKIGLENKVDSTTDTAIMNKLKRPKLQTLATKYKNDPEYKAKAIHSKSAEVIYKFLKSRNDKTIKKERDIIIDEKRNRTTTEKKKEKKEKEEKHADDYHLIFNENAQRKEEYEPSAGSNTNDINELNNLLESNTSYATRLVDGIEQNRTTPGQENKVKAFSKELEKKERNIKELEIRRAQLAPVPVDKQIESTTEMAEVMKLDSQIDAVQTQLSNPSLTPEQQNELQEKLTQLTKAMAQKVSKLKQSGHGRINADKLLQFGNGIVEALKQNGGMYGPTSRVEINGYPPELPRTIVKTQPVVRPIRIQGKGEPKERGLYSDEIDKMMAPYPNFLGTIAADEIKADILPKITKESKGGFVINTDSRGKSGKHWFAVYFDATPKGSMSIDVYDSFGRDPDKDLLKDIKSIADKLDSPQYLKLKINKIVRQKDTTNTCGYMAAKFLVDRFKGIPFKDCTGYNDSIRGEKDIKKVVDKYKKFGYI